MSTTFRGSSEFQAPKPRGADTAHAERSIPNSKHQIPNKSKIQSTKAQNAGAAWRSRFEFWIFFPFEFV
ncbi:MAG: hypothetical protein FJ280_13815 [Planctomycetes bacterium]|nr:hypothetical protein [Planctomycetota bacterium]